MTQHRGTITEQLDQVIQVLELGQRTGLLTIERETGGSHEEGKLNLSQGQITEAHVFILQQDTGAQVGYLQGQQAINWLKTWKMCRFIFEPLIMDYERSHNTGQVSGMERVTNPLRNTNPIYTPPSPTYTPEGYSSTDNINSFHNPSIPQRTRSANDSFGIMAYANLSRLHKRLFLYIDGQRTIADLSRLLGHGSNEVQQLLRDLKVIGIITYQE